MTDNTSAGLIRVAGCDLCRADRITPWYHEDDICWIAECEICAVPMVAWRFHGIEPPPEHLAHMHDRLRDVAATRFGEIPEAVRSEEHTSELQSLAYLVCRL